MPAHGHWTGHVSRVNCGSARWPLCSGIRQVESSAGTCVSHCHWRNFYSIQWRHCIYFSSPIVPHDMLTRACTAILASDLSCFLDLLLFSFVSYFSSSYFSILLYHATGMRTRRACAAILASILPSFCHLCISYLLTVSAIMYLSSFIAPQVCVPDVRLPALVVCLLSV